MLIRMTLTGVINDVHLPFHDPRAVNLVLDIFESMGIHRLIINGDLLDFLNISLHGPKHPDIQETLENELFSGQEFLSNLRKRFKGVEIVYLFGNHEDRLNRFIIQKCPAFWNVLRLETQLNLDSLDIHYLPYNGFYQLEDSKLRIQHSPPSYGINGTMTSLYNKLDHDYMYGCTHRMQHSARTGASGAVYNAWFNGWLGSTSLTETHSHVFSFAKGHDNWQQCAAVIATIDGQTTHVHQFPIINYSAYVGGDLYVG